MRSATYRIAVRPSDEPNKKKFYIYSMRALIQKAGVLNFFVMLTLHAQITITTADMPVVDHIYPFNTAATSVDFTTTGANNTWDYTGLSNSGLASDSFVNPASTPFVYQLIFNNFLFPAYDATHAQPGSDLTLPSQIPFTVTNVFNFYKNSSSSFKMVGFGATINGIPAPIQYQGADVWYQFPLTYGNQDTSTYFFEIPVPTLGYWNQSGTRYNHVDGFGTLLLPNGFSYQVIRLKSVTEIIDSVHIDALGFTIPLPRIQTDYKFLAAGEGEPVLQITTQPLLLVFGPEVVTKVKYKYEPNTAGTDSWEQAGLRVYPNPASDQIYLSNTQLKTWNKITLLNALGEVVYTNLLGGSEDTRLSLPPLPTGTYNLLVEMQDQKIYTQKIIIQ
jgi:hypothetical protein